MRCILLVLDGLGDKGHPCFDGRTPLQAARTPNLDRIAQMGMNGLYHSYLQGTAMPSEIAHFLMFGYDMTEIPGRGFIEAVGYGIPMSEGDVALLARLVPVARQGDILVVQQEEPDIDRSSCYALQESIRSFKKEDVEIELTPKKSLETILVMRGALSHHITDSNPIHAGRPLMHVLPTHGHENDPGAVRAASLLNVYLRLSHFALVDHHINRAREEAGRPPVNAVATQRAGRSMAVKPFRDKWGLVGASISAGPMYRGMCSLLELEFLLPPITVDPEQDLVSHLREAQRMTEFDFIHIHAKAPDEAAHSKDPQAKKAVIESLDRALKFALNEIVPDEDILFVITADHSTASTGQMIHSGETVPLTMTGKYVRRDSVAHFDEVSCAPGALSLVRGRELMLLILNFMDRGKLRGLRDSPIDQPYFPGRYKSLRI